MARGFPSMTALLGLLAVAGYQNRDKIAEWLGPRQGGLQPQQGGSATGLDSILGNLRGSLGGAGSGSLIGGGLRELIDRFQKNGKGDVAQSWVSRGPNKEIAPFELEQAIGDEVLADLSERTGLSRTELVNRLSRELPSAVDKYTPDGLISQES